MRAAVYEEFDGPVALQTVSDPIPTAGGAVLRVEATGICRSDWHGWRGHDPDITLPHVPGHEIAGVVESVGSAVSNWGRGDRVTLPFVCGCGDCAECQSGNQQVCDHQFQPGFTSWGSYAEYVAIDYADLNLVALPESLDFVVAASLGCRFATSFRAVTVQAAASEGQWVAVHGCGGVGLSAIMIAVALGARVIAVDVLDDRLQMAASLGAEATVNASSESAVAAAVKDLSTGGVHASIDAMGSRLTCLNSIECLRKRGKHVQVGLMVGDDRQPAIPMDIVVANELEILGSHGMQAHEYSRMLEMISTNQLKPDRLIGGTVDLDTAAANFGDQAGFDGAGVMVINEFTRKASIR